MRLSFSIGFLFRLRVRGELADVAEGAIEPYQGPGTMQSGVSQCQGCGPFLGLGSLDQPKVTPKEEIGVDQDEVDQDGGPQVRGGQYAPTD